MVDFKNKTLFKLKQDEGYGEKYKEIFANGEFVVDSFKSMRDGIIFTNYRMIIINVEGLTGKRTDFTSIPYKQITMYSVQTAALLDIDCELDVYLLGFTDMLRFEFTGRTKIKEISKFITQALIVKN